MPQKKNSLTAPSSKEGYEKFLKQLSLAGLGLNSCSADLNRALYFSLNPKNTANQVAVVYDLIHVDERFFNAQASFELKIFDENKKDKKPALSIDCVYIAHFHVKVPASKNHIKRFINSEFRLIVWPYYRELIGDLTGKMSIQPLTVPLSVNAF